MTDVGVRVTGGRQLRRELTAAGNDLADLKDSHRQAAAIVAAAARSRGPSRSGKLLATVRSAGTKSAAIVRAGTKAVPYAGPIHWGWLQRRPNSRHPTARGGPIMPNPWLAVAAHSTEPTWLKAYEARLATILDSIKGDPT